MIYASFQEASQACAGHGYEEAQLLGVIFEKTRRYRDLLGSQRPPIADPATARMLLGLCLAAEGGGLRVLDFGGACGAHYFAARAILGLRLQWAVVETPGMARQGRALETDELRFFDDLPAAARHLGGVDLAFSSGTIQYLADPYRGLENLAGCGARAVFLARAVLTAGDAELYAVQESKLSENGPGPLPEGMADGVARYPTVVARKTRVEEILARHHRIRIQFDEGPAPAFCKGQRTGVYGLLAERL